MHRFKREFPQRPHIIDDGVAGGPANLQQLGVAFLGNHQGVPGTFDDLGIADRRLLDQQCRIRTVFQPPPGLAELVVDLDARLDRGAERAGAIIAIAAR
jgi:hypothetical protein